MGQTSKTRTVNRLPYPRPYHAKPRGTGWPSGVIEYPSGRMYYVSPITGEFRHIPEAAAAQFKEYVKKQVSERRASTQGETEPSPEGDR